MENFWRRDGGVAPHLQNAHNSRFLCHALGMAKHLDIPISPMTLVCPKCGAKAGRACTILRGEVDLLHVERISAAGKKDIAAKKVRRK